jgi:hypothetical protein
VVPQEAIAEVLEVQPDGRRLSVGTAFAISQDFALTAFHVVGDRQTGVAGTKPIVLQFLRIREDRRTEPYECGASYRVGDSKLDAAILALGKPLPDDLRPIALTADIEGLEPFVSAGHPGLESSDISHIHGKVVAPRTSIYGGVPAIQLHSQEAGDGMPLGGMSGAPVLVGPGPKQAAIGLIRWNPTRVDDPALSVGGIVYACPVEVLAGQLSEFGAHWISRCALAELAQFPFPKVSESDCYDLLGVSKSEYVDQYQARGETPPYCTARHRWCSDGIPEK